MVTGMAQREDQGRLMHVRWWYDGITDQLNLRVNGCLETRVTFNEMIDTWLPMEELVMSKLMPLVFLSVPVHDEPLRR
jgi:hypothetical protein